MPLRTSIQRLPAFLLLIASAPALSQPTADEDALEDREYPYKATGPVGPAVMGIQLGMPRSIVVETFPDDVVSSRRPGRYIGRGRRTDSIDPRDIETTIVRLQASQGEGQSNSVLTIAVDMRFHFTRAILVRLDMPRTFEIAADPDASPDDLAREAIAKYIAGPNPCEFFLPEKALISGPQDVEISNFVVSACQSFTTELSELLAKSEQPLFTSYTPGNEGIVRPNFRIDGYPIVRVYPNFEVEFSGGTLAIVEERQGDVYLVTASLSSHLRLLARE